MTQQVCKHVVGVYKYLGLGGADDSLDDVIRYTLDELRLA